MKAFILALLLAFAGGSFAPVSAEPDPKPCISGCD